MMRAAVLLAAAGAASASHRMLVVHHRDVDPRSQCDRHAVHVMEGALELGHRVTYAAIPPSGSLAGNELPKECTHNLYSRLRQWARSRGRPWEFGVRLRKDGPGLPSGVKYVALDGTVCQALLPLMSLVSSLRYGIVLSPICAEDRASSAWVSFHTIKTSFRYMQKRGRWQSEVRPFMVALADGAQSAREGRFRDEERCSSAPGGWYGRRIARAREHESNSYNFADAVAFPTDKDAKLGLVHTVPALVESGLRMPVPPPAASKSAGWKQRGGIVFVGDGHDRADLLSVRWFINKVWPKLRGAGVSKLSLYANSPSSSAACQKLKCHCSWVQGGGGTPDGVHVHSALRAEDTEGVMNRARLLVVPSRLSHGPVGPAVALAAQYGVPLVATSEFVDALPRPLRPLVKEAAQDELGDAVLSLYESAEKWGKARSALANRAAAAIAKTPVPFQTILAAQEKFKQKVSSGGEEA